MFDNFTRCKSNRSTYLPLLFLNSLALISSISDAGMANVSTIQDASVAHFRLQRSSMLCCSSEALKTTENPAAEVHCLNEANVGGTSTTHSRGGGKTAKNHAHFSI
jgi:hypothetical protein